MYAHLNTPVFMRTMGAISYTVASSVGTNQNAAYARQTNTLIVGRGSGAVNDVYMTFSKLQVDAEL